MLRAFKKRSAAAEAVVESHRVGLYRELGPHFIAQTAIPADPLKLAFVHCRESARGQVCLALLLAAAIKYSY